MIYFSNARRFNPHDPFLSSPFCLFQLLTEASFPALSLSFSITAFCCTFGLSPAFPGSHHLAAMSSAHCIPSIHSATSLKTCLLTLKCESWRQCAHYAEVQEAGDGIFQTFVFGAIGAQNTKVGFVPSTEMVLKY